MKIIVSIIIIIFLFFGCTRQSNVVSKDAIINKNIDLVEKNEFNITEVNYTMFVNNPSGRITLYDAPFFRDNRNNRSHLNDLAKVIVTKEAGDIFNFGGYDGKWIYISSGNNEGWVFSGYLSLNEPQRILPQNPFNENTKFPLLNIADISRYIIWNLNLIGGFAYSLDEALARINLPEEYSMKNIRSFSSRHDDSIIEEYIIVVNDSYNFTIWANEKNDRYLIMELVVEINENNFIHLFPYNTINEYLEDENFGVIWECGEDYVKYFVETGGGYGDIWVLEFKRDLLYLIKYVPQLT